MAVRRHCRRRLLFFKIEVRPRPCRPYRVRRRCYVIMQGICNKFVEINFCAGCLVWQWLRLLQDWTFVKYWWDEHVLTSDLKKTVSIRSNVLLLRIVTVIMDDLCNNTPWTQFPFSIIKVENKDIISKFGVIGDTSKNGSLTVIDLYGAVTFTMGSKFFWSYYSHNDFIEFWFWHWQTIRKNEKKNTNYIIAGFITYIGDEVNLLSVYLFILR